MLVGIDNDLVDQLHQFVVGGRGNVIATALALAHLVLVQGRQQVADGTVVGESGNAAGAKKLIDGLGKLVIGGNPIHRLRAREHVVHDARALDLLRVHANHDHAFRGFFHRRPLGLLQEVALQVL
jgi:hypothetical protein